MLITPPDLAWVLLVLEGCGPGPWAARRHRLRRCLLTSGFTVVWLLRSFAVVMYGPVDPVLRPILSPHRALCRSTAPTLQFLYSGAGSIRNISGRAAQRAGEGAARLGQPGLRGHPGAARAGLGTVHPAGTATARPRPHYPGRAPGSRRRPGRPGLTHPVNGGPRPVPSAKPFA